jgi:hypothetical protein
VSRAKPVAERKALDFYATPQPLADAICARIGGWGWGGWPVVVEPSAGHGPFVRAARAAWPEAKILAVDVDPEKRDALEAAGANDVWICDWPRFAAEAIGAGERALIIGNPPYREAEEHIRAALDWMHPGDELAFLLRLNLLGSRGRVALWGSTPLAEVIPVVPRPSFTGGGSDATEYAVFRWVKGHTGPARLSLPLVWRA